MQYREAGPSTTDKYNKDHEDRVRASILLARRWRLHREQMQTQSSASSDALSDESQSSGAEDSRSSASTSSEEQEDEVQGPHDRAQGTEEQEDAVSDARPHSGEQLPPQLETELDGAMPAAATPDTATPDADLD